MLPEQFLNRMQEMLGEEYEAFLDSFSQDKYQALRLNRLKIGESGKNAAELLASEDGEVRSRQEISKQDGEQWKWQQLSDWSSHLTPVSWAKDGYYYGKEDQPGKHPYHEAGVYYIQEPSAMAPVSLLEPQPGEQILDLCAAPGGKSTQIAAAMKGEGILVSNEIHPARAKILSENIERMGIRNACVTNETPQHLVQFFPEYFDRILVDAPCSGEGMFRKNEAACDEWSPENVELCGERQDGILDCAAQMLRPGGRLVYSTCTFAPTENEGSISRFLIRHPEFSIVDIPKAELGVCGDGIPGYVEMKATDGDSVSKNKAQQHDQKDDVNRNDEASYRDEMNHNDETSHGDEVNRNDEASHRDEVNQNDETGHKHNDEVAQNQPNSHILNMGLEKTLRLWPHRTKGEGHYAAVLVKEGDVPGGYRAVAPTGIQKGIAEKELGEYPAFAKDFLRIKMQGSYMKFGDNIYLIPENMPNVKGLKVLRPGLHMGTLKKNRFEPSHALALALSAQEVVYTWNLHSSERTIRDYLNGQTFPAEGEKGWYLICVDGFSIGWGKLAGGVMKNHYPKGLRK